MIRGSNIDLALAVIEALRRPGETLSQQDIADICTAAGGVRVTHQDIYYLENRAVEKMRAESERRAKAAHRKAVLA